MDVKSFPSNKAHKGSDDKRILSNSARHQLTLPDHGYEASATYGVPAYPSAFAGTHCTYPWGTARMSSLEHRDGLPVCRRSPIQLPTQPGVS